MVASSDIRTAAFFSLHDLVFMLMEYNEVKMSDEKHVSCELRFKFRHSQQILCTQSSDSRHPSFIFCERGPDFRQCQALMMNTK